MGRSLRRIADLENREAGPTGDMCSANGRYPQAVSPAPERPPASGLVTQHTSQLLSPIPPNFGSGAPVAVDTKNRLGRLVKSMKTGVSLGHQCCSPLVT